MILVYALILHVYACDEIKITCDVLCKTDGDQHGFIIDNKCFCANQRDLSHIVVKVPKTGRAIIDKNRRYDEN